MSTTIAIIGGGHMGRALATGMSRNSSLDVRIVVADPNSSKLANFNSPNIRTTSSNEEAIASSDVVILAVKPQVIMPVCLEHSNSLATKLVVSIAAGVPMGHLEQWLSPSSAIVHCMPNLPASIGHGITALVANSHVSRDQRQEAERIFRSVGDAVWLEDDAMIDVVTAVAGSGPAYFYYVMDAMIEGATTLGMDAKTARLLVSRTALGAARMVIESRREPNELRDQVASRGGTTERAIQQLDARAVRGSLMNAVNAAFTRCTELTASL